MSSPRDTSPPTFASVAPPSRSFSTSLPCLELSESFLHCFMFCELRGKRVLVCLVRGCILRSLLNICRLPAPSPRCMNAPALPSTCASGGRNVCSYPQSFGLSGQERLHRPQVGRLGGPWRLRPQRWLLELHDRRRLAQGGGQNGRGRAEAAGIAGWDDDEHPIAGRSCGHRAQRAGKAKAREIMITRMVTRLHKRCSVYEQQVHLPPAPAASSSLAPKSGLSGEGSIRGQATQRNEGMSEVKVRQGQDLNLVFLTLEATFFISAINT